MNNNKRIIQKIQVMFKMLKNNHKNSIKKKNKINFKIKNKKLMNKQKIKIKVMNKLTTSQKFSNKR